MHPGVGDSATVTRSRIGLRVIAAFVALPVILLSLGFIDRSAGDVKAVEGIVTGVGESASSRHAPGRGSWAQVKLTDGAVVTCSAPASVTVGSRFQVSRTSSRILGRTIYDC